MEARQLGGRGQRPTPGVSNILLSSGHFEALTRGYLGVTVSPIAGDKGWSIRGYGGLFYYCNKMELTPDKNLVWGQLVVQGVCLSA